MNIIDQFRNTNQSGVRIRADGAGDPWANEHRDELGNRILMQDVDGFFGAFAFAKNTGDKLFMEYEPDAYENRSKVIRRFGIVALFDRKKSRESALAPHNVLTKAFYLNLCRMFAQVQGIAPKFFFVTGEARPWQMIEININTGEIAAERTLDNERWRDAWEACGLTQLRESVRTWVLTPEPIDIY